MRNLTQHNITQAVLARIGAQTQPRVREIVVNLVQHLHAFARDVRLTEREWMQGIEFLTATGQKCDDKRQEFILLSDVLGLSMLTVAMNNDKPEGCTEATVFGPFYVEGAPAFDLGADIAQGAAGQPCSVRGSIVGLGGGPVAGATIDVWQADADGKYDVQHEGLESAQGRGRFTSGAAGEFHFETVLAEPYPIPTDGPVGKLMTALNRHPWRPAHLHFKIEAPGYETLVTHVFRHGDRYLDSDAVFGVRHSLIAEWTPKEDGSFELAYDFVLNPCGDPAG
ncbi:MAG: hydroxyquinol 1,2-dioxygenase [Comamonadaceae bacterium]|nr:MAG: hydroxyquinol 1,2-dioxygenase [Comamonadaceae bacterium]